MWNYTDKVMDHFRNPRNVGEVEDPDGIGEVGSLACGDALRLTFKLDEHKRIKDIKFKTFGCASAIASSSALTEIVKGMTLEEAEKVTNNDIVQYLGALPEEKMHCSVMGQEALQAAIAYYRGKSVHKEESNLVCKCFGVTSKDIERVVIQNKLTTIEQVTHYTKAGGGCGNCHPLIKDIIDRCIQQMKHTGVTPTEREGKRLTTLQKIKRIEETIEQQIKPALRQDGGDLELIDIEGNRVYVALRGMCASCPASGVTLKQFVESKLREYVTPELEVEEVAP